MNPRYTMPQAKRRVRKRTGVTFYLALAILLILLAVSNPDKGDFNDYALKKMDTSFGLKFAEGVSNLVGQSLLETITQRDNYILFSVFSIPDVQDGTTLIKDVHASRKYLGLFKIIFIEF